MKYIVPYLSLLAALFLLPTCQQPTNEAGAAAQAEAEAADTAAVTERPDYAIVIHGGAGTIRQSAMTPEREDAYRLAMNEALSIGEDILQSGGSAIDAVEQTIRYLEDQPLFNAGKGAVFTAEGRNELDASFMDGATLNAGAIGGVTIIKNPISAARAVMEKSKHVMLTGTGAEKFALEQQLDTVPNAYFYTESRWQALQRAKAAEAEKTSGRILEPSAKFGTVGCVALDSQGNIAAGTSTGGMTNKKYNRIGDSPIIGAGTYAKNSTCGVSCTGHGEFFIRYAVAHDLSAMMEYQGLSLKEAGDRIVHGKLKDAGGSGGLIALDRQGNIIMPFNTEGMYRAYAKPDGREVKFYKE